MKTYSFLNKTFVVLLCTVLAFVCVSRPLQARADTASMDYVETDLSTNDVKALFTGASAIVPAAIMIIGFIVMCYCVLRNVEVPLSFNSQTSFTDKLTQLGQYAIDNATDDIKDFLYSVYTYCDDNGITSVLGLSKFVALQAAKFFGAITNWIGGSLIQNRTSIGNGLISEFVTSLNLSSLYNQYTHGSDLSAVFNTISSIPYYLTIGSCNGGKNGTYYDQQVYYNAISIVRSSPFVLVYQNGSFDVTLYFYTLDSSGVNIVPTTAPCKFSRTLIGSSTYGANISPNLGSYSTVVWNDVNYSSFKFGIVLGGSSGNQSSIDVSNVTTLINHLIASGVKVAQVIGSAPAASIPVADLPWLNSAEDVINPAADNVYVPTDVWNIDIVGTWEQIARDISATSDQTERIAAFVGDIPLTLTSAQSYAPTINDAGNYVFPDFGTVWKYPQYFFDTLSGWGMFVGNCLRAVTVDEGGLSWIFYGGFVLLVCGGIIGKILMG